MRGTKTVESAFTRDWPNADCYRDAVNGRQTGKPFCSCAPGVCAKREDEEGKGA